MKKILDLIIWQDIKIAIYNPVIIDENNLFKYNLSSEYIFPFFKRKSELKIIRLI